MSFSEKLRSLSSLPEKLLSLTRAVVSGSLIEEERIQKRLAICFDCENISANEVDGKITFSCGVCGCSLKGQSGLLNLAAYEETSSYGCKAVGGSKWLKAGV